MGTHVRGIKSGKKAAIARCVRGADFLLQQAELLKEGGEVVRLASAQRLRQMLDAPCVTYTRETGLKVCEAIANGIPPPLLEGQPWYPGTSVVVGWIMSEPSFMDLIRKARLVYGETCVWRAHILAEEPHEPGDMAKESRRKAGLDFFKWAAERASSKAWGQKMAVTSDHTENVNITFRSSEIGEEAWKELLATRGRLIEGELAELENAEA